MSLDYEVRNSVAWLKFNRPDEMNTFSIKVRDDMLAAFDQTDADDQVRAVVITGSGRAFCAGADLSMAADTFNKDARAAELGDLKRDSGGMVTLRMFESKKPIVAAINGHAVGIGITMTLAADIRIAVPDAKIGFVFSRRGIVPEAASTWFLPRLVGVPTALDWMMSGRIFRGAEAYERGLVQQLVEPDQLESVAQGIAEQFTEGASAVSVAAVRELVWRGFGAAHPMDAHEAESVALYDAGRGPDAAEGVMSFLEKREPAFPAKVSESALRTGYPQPEFEWRG